MALQRKGTSREGKRGPCMSPATWFDYALSFDIFAKKPELRLPSGETKYNTVIGCMSTLVLVGATALAGYMSFDDILNNKDKMTYITHSVKEDFFTSSDTITLVDQDTDDVDAVAAFGIVSMIDGDSEPSGQIGTLVARNRIWDYDAGTIVYEDIPIDKCSKLQLGLSETVIPIGQLYQPRDNNSRAAAYKYQNQLYCIQGGSSYTLKGNSNSMAGQSLEVGFQCTGENCASDKMFFMQDKAFIVYTNQQIFDDRDIEEPYLKTAKFYMIPTNSQTRQNTFIQLKQTLVKTLETVARPFGDWNDEEYPIWEFKRGNTVGYMNSDSNMLGSITIERDLNLYKTEWKINNPMLIQLGMLGGFMILLWIVVYAIEFVLTNKKFQNYMASELYYVPEDLDREIDEVQVGCMGKDELTRLRYSIPRDLHNEIIDENGKVLDNTKVGHPCKPFMCCRVMMCQKRRRIERVFKKARVYNAQELNVTSIIKAQRQNNAACELLRKHSGYYEVEIALERAIKRAIVLSDDDQIFKKTGDEESNLESIKSPAEKPKNAAESRKENAALGSVQEIEMKDSNTETKMEQSHDRLLVGASSDLENEQLKTGEKKKKRSKSKSKRNEKSDEDDVVEDAVDVGNAEGEVEQDNEDENEHRREKQEKKRSKSKRHDHEDSADEAREGSDDEQRRRKREERTDRQDDDNDRKRRHRHRDRDDKEDGGEREKSREERKKSRRNRRHENEGDGSDHEKKRKRSRDRDGDRDKKRSRSKRRPREDRE